MDGGWRVDGSDELGGCWGVALEASSGLPTYT